MRGNTPSRNHSAARVEKRYKTFFLASACTSNGVMRVHILDVSRAGARLHGTFAVGIGDVLRIAFAGDQVAARVRWIKGDMFGTQFCSPLSQSAQTRIMSLLGISVHKPSGPYRVF